MPKMTRAEYLRARGWRCDQEWDSARNGPLNLLDRWLLHPAGVSSEERVLARWLSLAEAVAHQRALDDAEERRAWAVFAAEGPPDSSSLGDLPDLDMDDRAGAMAQWADRQLKEYRARFAVELTDDTGEAK